jgi:hypothetical protein
VVIVTTIIIIIVVIIIRLAPGMQHFPTFSQRFMARSRPFFHDFSNTFPARSRPKYVPTCRFCAQHFP